MLIRTNIVADFPGRNGYIYKKSALVDLVNMKSASGLKGIITNDYLPDYNGLIWLMTTQNKDFVLNNFKIVNDELVVDVSFTCDNDINIKDCTAHPYVISYDTIRTDKIITKIEAVVGIILVKNGSKINSDNSKP